jgi:hypothetical protein
MTRPVLVAGPLPAGGCGAGGPGRADGVHLVAGGAGGVGEGGHGTTGSWTSTWMWIRAWADRLRLARRGTWGPAVAGADQDRRCGGRGCSRTSTPPTRGRRAWWSSGNVSRQTLVQLPVPRESLLVHAGNSAAALRWPRVCRGRGAARDLPVWRERGAGGGGRAGAGAGGGVRARLVHVREVESGCDGGVFASTWPVGRERWGTLAIGYGDGIPRILGNRGSVLVRGREGADHRPDQHGPDHGAAGRCAGGLEGGCGDAHRVGRGSGSRWTR